MKTKFKLFDKTILTVYLLSLIFVLVWNFGAVAQSPPPSVRGQSQSALLPKPNLHVPFSQVTDLGGLNALIETGNRNLLANPGFEHRTFNSGWTVSGTNNPTSSATILIGTKSLQWDTTTNENLSASAVTIPVGLRGSNGEFSCLINSNVTSYLLEVTDGTNTLNSVSIPLNSPSSSRVIGNFVFPSSGSVTLRVRAQSSGTIIVDDCYLGPATNLGSGAIITNWQDYNLVIGATTTAPTLGTTTINRAQWRRVGGDMEIRYDLRKTTGGTAGSGVYLFPIPSGFTVDTNRLPVRPGGTAELATVGNGKISATNDSGGVTTAPLTVLYSHSFPNNVYLNYIIGPSVEQTQTVNSAAYPATTNPWSISFIAKVPIQGWDGNGNFFRADTIGWKVDASISGANPTLGTSGVSAYTEITNATLNLTNNSGLGNIPAQIPCSGTNPSTGTNCAAGNESLGVVFNLPVAGDVEVCAYFNHFREVTGGSNALTAFQLIETPNNAQTILQEGKTRIGPSGGAATAQTYTRTGNVNCGWFSFSSAGQKTIRLTYEQSVVGTIVTNIIQADANAAEGQPDVRFTVTPLNQVVPAPLIANSVISNTSSMERIERADIVSGAVARQSGSWISGVTNPATGQYTLTLQAGLFSSLPSCVASVANGGAGNNRQSQTFSTSTTSINVGIAAAGTATNGDFSIICMGAR